MERILINFLLHLSWFFLATFSLTGCAKKKLDSTSMPLPIVDMNGQKKYIALGDSYTIGQDVATDQRFPAQTVAILRQLNISVNDPQYIANTGWTTENLNSSLNQQDPQGPYDVVTLLIGVNDQYQRMDTGGYRTRFTQLLLKSLQLAGNDHKHVFILSIPDYSVTPFVHQSDKARVRREIDLFNLVNKDVAQKNNVNYLDITPSSREAENDRSLIANDGLHPSGKEYKKWAEMLAPMIKEKL